MNFNLKFLEKKSKQAQKTKKPVFCVNILRKNYMEGIEALPHGRFIVSFRSYEPIQKNRSFLALNLDDLVDHLEEYEDNESSFEEVTT